MSDQNAYDEHRSMWRRFRDWISNLPSLKRIWYDFRSRPYLRVVFEYTRDGSLEISAEFNRHVVYDIDRQYKRFAKDPFDDSLPDHDKVMRFVSDMIADNTDPGEMVGLDELPPELMPGMLDRAAELDAPSISQSPVRDVVDINTLERVGGPR